jgi:hypothetical protein
MRAFVHPLRLDDSGAMVTIDDQSDRYAGQLAGVVVTTNTGERGMAPAYGLVDPSATPISLSMIASTITSCEPDLQVTSISSTLDPTSAAVNLSVTWAT